MLRSFCLVVLVAALSGGALAQSAAAGDTWSVKGNFTSSFTLSPTSDPAVFDFADVGAGTATRIGKFTWAATEVDNLVTGTINNGVATLTMPSGDAMFWAYSGTFVPTGPTTVNFSTTAVITGGTGRFSGASGTGTLTGSADVASQTLSATFDVNMVLPK